MPIRRWPILLALPLALTIVGCGGDAEEAEGEETTTTSAAAETTTSEAPEETTTSSAEPQRPTTSLVPEAPEWDEACATGDQLIDEAWQLQEGTLTDRTQVAVSMLTMINQLPPGAAEAEKAEIIALINAFLGGGDVTAYQANFRPNAEALLSTVATNCGVEEGGELPLPPDVLTEIYDFLYPNG